MAATAAKIRAAGESVAQRPDTPKRRELHAERDELESLGAWHPICVSAALEELTHAKLVCRLCVLGCGALLLLSVLNTLVVTLY